MPDPNSCNCCEGLSVEIPVEITNRPGLNAIAYRVGMHSSFKESLLARISLSGLPALKNLTTRVNSDFSIALLDSWSVVADILTFYQERIANESYLRTATERFSVLELSRLIDYELRPGLAASAYLAFTLEEAQAPFVLPGAKNDSANAKEGLSPVSIEKGTKVQSIPGPDEMPQLFETLEKIETRPEWNAIKPRSTQPLKNTDAGLLIFKGISNNIKEGDILLISANNIFKTKKVVKVSLDTEAKTTTVYFDTTATIPFYQRPAGLEKGNTTDFLTAGALDEATVVRLINLQWAEEDLAMVIAANKWSAFELLSSMSKIIAVKSAATPGPVYVFRKRAFVFGYNAPEELKLDANGIPSFSEWSAASEGPGRIYLDSAYDEILAGSYIAVQKVADMVAHPPDIYPVNTAEVRSRTQYKITTKTTEITFTPKSPNEVWWAASATPSFADIRPVTVYAQTERLALEELPIADVVDGNIITLNHYYPGLKSGQTLILTGDRDDLKGVTASEVIVLKNIIVEEGLTVLELMESLQNKYIRSSVNISANVGLATNGETTEEVMGSGDASQAFQQFTLRQPPLTYISGATDTGTVSTLEVRVNNVVWHEVEHFPDHLPNERIYITRRTNEAKTTVIFGDGLTGARLPTGQENIKAKYRKGIGVGGNVKANQLSQLLTRPLGVKSAFNPLPAKGAANAEVIEEAKTNAPLGILTLGRIVSLQDYEDFARAFAGVAKALATWSWVAEKRHIFITIAGVEGEEISKESVLYDHLFTAIRQKGDPGVPLTLESYTPKFFRLKASLKIDPDYLAEDVLTAVKQNLRDTFSFSRRQFGQAVTYGEVVKVIHGVKGLVAVDIDQLFRSDEPKALNYFLQAGIPAGGDENVSAAELLLLDQRPIDLNIMP